LGFHNEKLIKMKDEHKIIGEVRGKAAHGMELVKDQNTKEPLLKQEESIR
jgi:4-aminobutyrate aminotransferase-like enzyme